MVFTARTINHQYFFDDPEKFTILLQSKNIEWLIEVKQKREKRSLNQNAYYWGVVIPIIQDYMGEEIADEVHEEIKYKFLPRYRNGERVASRSSKRLDTKEFEDYMSKVRSYFSREHGVQIPEPNETSFRYE